MSKLNRVQRIILILIVILTCILAALLALLITLLIYQPDTPTPPTPQADTSWSRILANRRIIVGTAADYPPFVFYNDRLQLDGFDIVLMRAVGEKLGVQVVFQDIIFDSLGTSLNLGQIDAAISSIAITPEREAAFSFSNVYYVSEDGVLARAGSPISSITSADQLALWRVGVQTGSIYQTWLQNQLVDSGKMSPGNLLAYPRMDQATSDLQAGKIELVVMDAPAADKLAAGGSFKVVGRGNNSQRYAILLRQGNDMLRSRINDALTQLQNEGRIAQMAQTYLKIEPGSIVIPPTPLPTALPTSVPTFAPPPTATPAGFCVDGMAFVSDLSYPDYNMTTFSLVPPNTTFQKGWRIRNTGSCTWNNAYILRFVSGNHPAAGMSGAPTPILGVVPPGGEYDLFINLIAPPAPGVYQASWALTNPRGEAFGQRLWVAIQVPQTVQPTQPAWPTPTIWPTQPPPGSGPFISRFEIDPASINEGECTYLYWEVQGAVDQVRILRNGKSIWETAPARYALTECPAGVSLISYEIQAIGPGGTAREIRQLMIYPAPRPTPRSAWLPWPSFTQFLSAHQ